MTIIPLEKSLPDPIIFLIGFMGSGKSMLSRGVGVNADVVTVEMDDEIVTTAGMSINEIFATRGETYFRKLERSILQNLIEQYRESSKAVLISTGGGAPCYYDNMEIMNRAGTTIFIDVSADRLASRLECKKQERPLIRNKTSVEIREYVVSMLEERLPYYLQANIRMNPLWDNKQMNIQLLTDILQETGVLYPG